MKITVVGLRGFPDIQGGIETHCEELYPRLAACGCQVTVVRRKGFIRENPVRSSYKGVYFKDIHAPSVTGFEAAIHTLRGVWYAYRSHTDLLHIHAIGPAIAVPVAKLLGLKVVVTHHGPDYNREKWGFFARLILKTGEYFTAAFADRIIAISTVITDILQKKHKRTAGVHLIYNGVTPLPLLPAGEYMERLGIESGKYILAVGRFVEEKRFDKLIEAYIKLKLPGYRLVIVGDSDYETSYACFLKNFAAENQVVLTGMLKGEKLQTLYSHAALFVLPSSHEGLPITLLEAMSFKRKVLASDIPANLAVGLPPASYFQLNDLNDLVMKMKSNLTEAGPQEQTYDLSLYDWDRIARQVLEVYRETVGRPVAG